MAGILIVTAFVVLLGLFAARFGVDSRDGLDWREGPDRGRADAGRPLPTLVSPY